MNFEQCNGTTYMIQRGDTLYSISRRYNIPLSLILRANPYVDVYNLQIGDELCIPSQGQGGQIPVSGPATMNRPQGVSPIPFQRPNMEPGPVIPDMGNENNESPVRVPEMGPGPVIPNMGNEDNQGPVRVPEMGPGPVIPNMGNEDNESPVRVPEMGLGPVVEMPETSVRTNTNMRNDFDMLRERMMNMQNGSMARGSQSGSSMNDSSSSGSFVPPSSNPTAGYVTVVKYVVRDKDTIQSILESFNMLFEDLHYYNDLSNIELKPGTMLRVPTTVED